MAERSITSTNQNMHLLMLDMSKAFDTVNRSILLKDLSKIIENDELHLISIMLNTKLRVRCGSSISEIFQTNTGVPQGDSLSANQFTFYLAKALQIENKTQNDHDYTSYNTQTRKIISLDHNYSKQQNKWSCGRAVKESFSWQKVPSSSPPSDISVEVTSQC